ncbi:cytochrome c [Candidatus Bipolaricaulota bacterium]|nr:cytochrome c [Candidatus Bipolaricaulota bacterium]
MPVARSNNQGGQKYKPRGGASLASGKSYVRANCLGCHRVDGEGSGIDLSKVGNKYSVAALKYYLKYEHPMPWKGSDAEREAVARYLVSLQSGSQAAFASHNEEAKGRETEGKAAKNGGEFRQLAQDMPVPDAPTGLTVTPAIVAADKGSFWAGRPRYMDIELRLSWNSVSGAAYYKAYVYGYSNGTSYYLPGYESGFQIPEFETGAGINRELKMDASGRCFATLGPITFVGKDIPKALIVWVVGVNEAGEGYRSKPAIVSIPNPWE